MKVPSVKWRQEFSNYLSTIPFYYAQPLNKALKRYGISVNVIPDQMDGSLPPPTVMQLKSLKQQSKKESNRWHLLIENDSDNSSANNTPNKSPYDKKKGTPSNSSNEVDKESPNTSQLDKNVFDISRENLLDRIQRMRTHVFTKENFSSEEAKHNVPISQMGNFQDSLMKREVLRDVFEINDARKRPIFGNPYRNEKSPRFVGNNNIIDEAESDPARKQNKSNSPSSKQKNPLISGLFVADELSQETKPVCIYKLI